MTHETVQRIKNNPKYQKLVRTRSRFAWTLSIIMLAVYYIFILTIAFKPEILGIKMGAGVMTIGIPIGIAVIIIAFVLAGLYVKRANSEFDSLTQEVKDELREEV